MAERNSWHRRPFPAFDLETTGIDVHTDRIVTASIVDVDAARRTSTAHEWLVIPEVDIPETATRVHGVTTEKARSEGRPARDVFVEIDGHFRDANAHGRPIVVFNGAFDMSLLHAEFVRHELKTDALEDARIVDAHVIDKKLRWGKGSRRLDATAEFYGVELDDAHNSSADSLATARIAYQLAERYPDDVQVDLDALHETQKGWRADQTASLQAFLRGKPDGDPETLVSPQWPIRLPGDDEDASKSPYLSTPQQKKDEAAARRLAAEQARSEVARAADGVRDGHYGVTSADGSMELYRVDKPDSGRWKGFTFVKREVDGEYEDVRDQKAKSDILTAIAADPRGALVAYGHSTGVCGRCHRTLTDETSVAAGIGPKCASMS